MKMFASYLWQGIICLVAALKNMFFNFVIVHKPTLLFLHFRVVVLNRCAAAHWWAARTVLVCRELMACMNNITIDVL